MCPFSMMCFTHKTFKIGLNSKTIYFETNRALKTNLNECRVTLLKTFLSEPGYVKQVQLS